MNKQLLWSAAALTMLTLGAPPGRADFIVNVSLNTSVLASDPSQGPFAVDFQLNDGSGAGGDGNNTAIVSNFNLNGGSLTAGTDNSTGGVSGGLGSTLTVTDSGFLNDFNQQFAPGSILSFTVDLTTNVNASEIGSPDEFSFTVYSNGFTSQASLLTIDISGTNPSISASGGSLGDGTSVSAPNYTTASPEPASLSLFGLGLGTLTFGAWRRQRRAA